MVINIYIFAFILICTPALAQQVQVSRDELPNTNSTDSTAVLNNVLRQNQNAINSIGGYFNSNEYLKEANGGTGANLSTAPNGSLFVQDGTNVGIGTINPGTSGQYLKSQGAAVAPIFAALPADINMSNVLFQYQGQVENAGGAGASGEITASTFTTSGTGNYRFLQTAVSTNNYIQSWTAKFIKVAGISTVTVYGRIWVNSAGGPIANLKVDIGGLNSNVSGTANQVTPEWVHFTIDVSSLTNGTAYDVTASLKNADTISGARIYCSNIMGFGS